MVVVYQKLIQVGLSGSITFLLLISPLHALEKNEGKKLIGIGGGVQKKKAISKVFRRIKGAAAMAKSAKYDSDIADLIARPKTLVPTTISGALQCQSEYKALVDATVKRLREFQADKIKCLEPPYAMGGPYPDLLVAVNQPITDPFGDSPTEKVCKTKYGTADLDACEKMVNEAQDAHCENKVEKPKNAFFIGAVQQMTEKRAQCDALAKAENCAPLRTEYEKKFSDMDSAAQAYASAQKIANEKKQIFESKYREMEPAQKAYEEGACSASNRRHFEHSGGSGNYIKKYLQ